MERAELGIMQRMRREVRCPVLLLKQNKPCSPHSSVCSVTNPSTLSIYLTARLSHIKLNYLFPKLNGLKDVEKVEV